MTWRATTGCRCLSAKACTLQVNGTLVRIQQQVRSLVRAQDDGSGLASAGFELDRNGALSIKDAKLKDLLNNPEKMRTEPGSKRKPRGSRSITIGDRAGDLPLLRMRS